MFPALLEEETTLPHRAWWPEPLFVLSNTCREAYEDCLKLKEAHTLEFTAMDEAIDWLKRHRQELLVGTIVTTAGVTFIVVSAGAGILVLAPLVLMTQSGTALEDAVCEG